MPQNSTEVNVPLISSFPGSKKIYIEGSKSSIRVPMREIQQHPTVNASGTHENPSIRVYDTSGPFTDQDYTTDIRKVFFD